jgi:hypothetical protein
MIESQILLDPTAEVSPAKRQRVTPPDSLEGKTIALLDIGKRRGNVFLDRLEECMAERGLTVKRYAKPTNTKVAPLNVVQTISMECDIVVEALSD